MATSPFGMTYLASLNPAQRAVATHPDGHLIVLAGPGSGKTRALTARIAHCVLQRGVAPSTITAITFSRRAANELRTRLDLITRPPSPSGSDAHHARIQRVIGQPSGAPTQQSTHQNEALDTVTRSSRAVATRLSALGGRPPEGAGRAQTLTGRGETIWAGTFHAFGARILRIGGARHFGRTPDFTIYDEENTDRAIRRILGTLGVDDTAVIDQSDGADFETRRQRTDRVAEAVRAVSLAKRSGATIPDDDTPVSTGGPPLRAVFDAYEAALVSANAVDFDDLIGLSGRALERDDELRARVRRRATHLFVDEYQDTDSAQERLLVALNPDDLCVVADPEQSIYSFRGATPDSVGRFFSRWPRATTLRLEQNYRSSSRIVAIAQRLRDAGPGTGERAQLRLWTRNAPGVIARAWGTNRPEREAQLIAADITQKIANGSPAGEIAILTRTHAQMRPFEETFMRAGTLPFAVVGGFPFFRREEVRTLLNYLRVALSDRDTEAFWAIINTPRRGLGRVAITSIAQRQISSQPSLPPLEALRLLADANRCPDGGFDLLALIDEARAQSGAQTRVGDMLRLIVARTDFAGHLAQAHPTTHGERLARVESLFSIGDRYTDIRRFLDDAALSTAADDPFDAIGQVRISTVHAAKGAEFDHVYLPGCEDGIHPIRRRAGRTTPTMEPVPAPVDPEDRRIFYVGVTRARLSLTVSFCSFRQGRRTVVSPFVGESGADLLIRCEPGTADGLTRRARRTANPTSTDGDVHSAVEAPTASSGLYPPTQ